MKKLSLYASAIAVTCGATVLLAAGAVHRSEIVADHPDSRMDAAFRDGLFLGRMDSEAGRKQHLITGRWSEDADRRLFVSGYLEAYREKYGAIGAEEFASSVPVERAGYRAGISDGLKDRQESARFRPSATEHYRQAECLCSADRAEVDQSRRLYRDAYSDGYQQAYYGDAQ